MILLQCVSTATYFFSTQNAIQVHKQSHFIPFIQQACIFLQCRVLTTGKKAFSPQSHLVSLYSICHENRLGLKGMDCGFHTTTGQPRDSFFGTCLFVYWFVQWLPSIHTTIMEAENSGIALDRFPSNLSIHMSSN